MRDRETDSWWSIISSDAIGGPLAGADLVELPVSETTTWGDWRARHPDTLVLSVDGREHEPRDPYADYLANQETFRGVEIDDRRLPPKEPVFAFLLGGRAHAVPHAAARGARLIPLEAGRRLLVHRPVEASLRVSTRAYLVDPDVDGTADQLLLAARAGADGIRPLPGIDTFWYGWAAIHRDTRLLP